MFQINRSVLAKFPSDADLLFFHAFHHLKTSGICTKADIGMSSGGLIIAAMCLADKQLIRIALHVAQNAQDMCGDESLLQGNNMFNRIFKGQSAWSDTWDMTVANTCAGNLVIYSIHQDGTLRAWDVHVSMKPFIFIWEEPFKTNNKDTISKRNSLTILFSLNSEASVQNLCKIWLTSE